MRGAPALLLAGMCALLPLCYGQDGFGFGSAQGARSGINPAQGAAATWTPALATGLVAWWDLTSTTYVSTSGSNVTGVTDRSGNGHDLNVISATAPTFNSTRFGAALGGVDFVAGSSTFLARNSAPVTAAPFQVYVVARSSSITAFQSAFWLGDKDQTAQDWAAAFRGDVASDPINWGARAGGGFTSAATSTGYTANTTRLMWGLETSSTSRAVRLDGAGEGTNTSSLAPAGADRVGVGAMLDSTPSNYLDGSIAEVVLLNTASTADRTAFHTYFAARYGITIP